jgi:hypothetical protein
VLIGTAAVLAAAILLLVGAPSPRQGQSPPAPLLLDAGNDTQLRIDRTPFRLALTGPDGSEQVATVAGREGPPVRVPGIDGPQPVEPLGPLAGFPALGFVVGARPDVTSR